MRDLAIFVTLKPLSLIFLWTVLIQGIWLTGSLDIQLPFSVFLYGDSTHYLDQAYYWVKGIPYNAGLPFHPPLTGWMLVPLWILFQNKETVWVLSKVLMIVLNGLTISLFYLTIRKYVPKAMFICLLIPFNFGELVLSASANSETVYRLLLMLILWLGFRGPFLSGILQALACLTRAEHLWLWLFCCMIGLLFKSRRRFFIYSMIGCVVILLPYTLKTAWHIHSYNVVFKNKLQESLPVIVPISLYGPLNFALAQESDTIFFTRSLLPSSPEGKTQLDPLFAPHNRYLVSGYSIGFRWIVDNPWPWIKKFALKIAYSTKALSYGWTWRDFPNKGIWLRQPVDMAHSYSLFYHILSFFLIGLGIWTLRKQKTLLWIGGTLLLYRLVANILFFPYLRSMMIISPLWLLYLFSGLIQLSRKWSMYVLIGLLLIMFMFHGLTFFHKRDYHIQGRSDQNNRMIQDDLLTITFVGFYAAKGET